MPVNRDDFALRIEQRDTLRNQIPNDHILERAAWVQGCRNGRGAFNVFEEDNIGGAKYPVKPC